MGRKAYTPEQKQIAKINRNTWRRALYTINKIIKSGASYRIDEFKGLKELKKRYKDFQKRTNLANTGNLEEDIKTFIQSDINKTTPKQAKTASEHLLDHLKQAVKELNDVGGDPKKASKRTQQYYNVMLQLNAISKKSEKNGDPKKWILNEDKVPDAEDFANVSDKYLKWKRCIQTFFPEKEYAEAYGSEYEK